MAVSSSKVYYIRSYENLARYLDVYGNNQVLNGNNVITWTNVPTATTQKWKLKNSNTNTKILSNHNSAFSLDHWIGSTNYGKCDMYEDKPGNDVDQLITLVPYIESQNLYKIKLVNHSKFLTASAKDGNEMFWLADNNQTNQVWKFEEYVVPPFTLLSAISTVTTDKYTLEYFSSTPGAIAITSKRVITKPSLVNNEKKISNISLPFAQTSTYMKSVNANYGSSCKGFAMAALLTFYSQKLISPHWFTSFGWVPPNCDNSYVTSAVTYEGRGAFKLVAINTGNTTLDELKTKIDAGIPVLLRFKVSDKPADQHWVVVYGYKGTGTSKSDFLVVDSANTTQSTTPNYGKYFDLDQSSSWSFPGKAYTITESYYMTDN